MSDISVTNLNYKVYFAQSNFAKKKRKEKKKTLIDGYMIGSDFNGGRHLGADAASGVINNVIT